MEYQQRTLIQNRIEEYAMTQEDFTNPHYIMPIMDGEHLHIGYTPLSEKEAFEQPIPQTQHIFSYHFRISREKLSLDQLISCIRKILLYPSNNIALYTEPSHQCMFHTVLYRVTFTIDKIESEQLNDGIVCVIADLENDAYLVEANRYFGDRIVFYRFYKTLRHYIENGGTHDPSIINHCGDILGHNC